MNQILAYLAGTCRVTICAAAPERCINVLPGAGITFWDIRCLDELHYSFSVFQKDRKRVEALAKRHNAHVEAWEEKGLPVLGKRLKKRPVLVLSMAAALFLTFFLQSFVWVIEVEGNDTVPEEKILRALEEQNIGFGTWGPDINSNLTRMRMVNAVPELSWLAVNRRGGKLIVPVTERAVKEEDSPGYAGANLVAAANGVITDYAVLEGMNLCKRGDTVRKGQLLVSGYEDYGLFVRRVCASGEIYARTWYEGTLVTPAYRRVKTYTGRQWQVVSLILGRKRINLSGNSRISYDSCDKMISVKRLKLPGYEFPAALEIAVYREYTLSREKKSPASGQEELRRAWITRLRSSMVAGTVEETTGTFLAQEELLVYRAESICNEMIARQVPLEEPKEGEIP